MFLCVILLISCTLALLCFLNDLALNTWNHNWTLGEHFLSMVKQGRVGGFFEFLNFHSDFLKYNAEFTFVLSFCYSTIKSFVQKFFEVILLNKRFTDDISTKNWISGFLKKVFNSEVFVFFPYVLFYLTRY